MSLDRAYLDTVDWWLSTIGGKLLTPDEEKDLARRRDQGDEKALHKLIESSRKLVVFIAKQYTGTAVSLEDRISLGNEGLVRAAEKFDPERGFHFSTMATPWIRQAIRRGLEKEGYTIRTPVYVQEQIRDFNKAFLVLTVKLLNKRKPTVEEMAAELKLTVKQTNNIIRCMILQPVSADEIMANSFGEESLLEKVEAGPESEPEQRMFSNKMEEDIFNTMQRFLSPDEENILIFRFGMYDEEEMTLEELGQLYKVTRERIRQIEARALKKLRENALSRELLEIYASKNRATGKRRRHNRKSKTANPKKEGGFFIQFLLLCPNLQKTGELLDREIPLK